MSDEIKKKKFVKVAGKFLFFTGAVFLGVTLAILLSAAILKPKHPPMRGPVPMGIERRLPPPPMPDHHFGPQRPHKYMDGRAPLPEMSRKPPIDKNSVRPDVPIEK